MIFPILKNNLLPERFFGKAADHPEPELRFWRNNLFWRMEDMKLGTLLSMAAMAVMGMGLALPAQAADPIKIGVYLPLTGQNAFGGQLELEGIQLAHKLKPTVLDRPVELVVVDNKSDKVEAANAVKRLTEHEKVLAIIGTYGSSLAMAGGEVAERAKVPVIGTSCTNPLVTQGKKYYFRACFIDPYPGAAAATYAYKNLGYKKAAAAAP